MNTVWNNTQLNAIKSLYKIPRGLLIGGCGVGKTRIVLGLILKFLESYGLKSRILLVAPLNILQSSYTYSITEIERELNNHFFTKFTESLILNATKPVLKEALKKNSYFIALNREKLSWVAHNNFDLIIVDESSLFKNPSSIGYNILKRLSNKTARFYSLTGTIYANNIVSIYAQVSLLNHFLLESTLSAFRAKYMYVSNTLSNGIRLYTCKESAIEDLLERITPITIKIPAAEVEIPLYEFIIVKDSLPADVIAINKGLKKASVLEKYKINVVNAGQIILKQHQIASGGFYDENEDFYLLHTKRITFINSILTHYKPESLIIYYTYKFELSILKDFYPQGVEFSVKVLDAWNNQEIPILFVNLKSASHGINLQYGGCTLAYISIPFSNELFIQSVSRVIRRGQKHPVKIFIPQLKGSCDKMLFTALKKHSSLAHKHFCTTIKIT